MHDHHHHGAGHSSAAAVPPTPPSAPGKHAGHEPAADHDKHAGHSVAMFRDRFWLSLALTIPILIWGHMLQAVFGYTAPAFPGSQWLPAVLGTVVFVYGGTPFIRGAVSELRDRAPGMMTLIALAISVAFAFSVAVVLGFPGMPLWEELATLVTIMLLGHWIEMRSISQAEGALAELAKLLPDLATRVDTSDGHEQLTDIPVAELQTGDIILVRPGSAVAADGIVQSGQSAVDEAMLTGESRPVQKGEGDRVIAGTISGSGSLRVQVTGTGNETTLAGIMRLVDQAQGSRGRAQALADRAAKWLTYIALAAGIITLVTWIAIGAEPAYAVERMVTVLVIACPHALGLAVPLVIAISTTIGAGSGLLIRDRRGLEDARRLNAVVFDKTGTLTLGEHRVVAMLAEGGGSEDDALRLAAAVEGDSEHPVARAIVASAVDRALDIPSAAAFEAMAGLGVRAEVGGRQLSVGGPNLLRDLAVAVPAEFSTFADASAGRGEGVVHLLAGTDIIAAFAVADAVRPESRAAVERLQELGVEVIMLTGDAQAVANAVAAQLGIDTVIAEVMPDGKAGEIEALQRSGKVVAMVGDGVNDAPALATADVGIAVGAGTDVAVESGDIVLMRSDPRDIARVITLSRASYRKMVQNLWWAAGYNIVAIPLAAGVLAPLGFVLSPAVGAVLMSLSTVVVAANAQLLRRVDL